MQLRLVTNEMAYSETRFVILRIDIKAHYGHNHGCFVSISKYPRVSGLIVTATHSLYTRRIRPVVSYKHT